MYGRQTNDHPEMITPSSSGPCEYISWHNKMNFADVIKVMDFEVEKLFRVNW